MLSQEVVSRGQGRLNLSHKKNAFRVEKGQKAMTALYYFAAWTDSGCLIGCSHEHGTVSEAVACIACAGGYVIAVENGVLRALTAEEEAQFQRAIDAAYRDRPAAVEDFHYDTSGYAVMIPVRLVDRRAWMTWMRYETYGQALANARQGNKIVPFGSAEWTNLRMGVEPALPIPAVEPPKGRLHRSKEESLVEFVLRFLDEYGFGEQAAPSDASCDSNAVPARFQLRNDSSTAASDMQKVMLVSLVDFIDLVLNWLNTWELSELERMHAKQVPVWLETLRDRARRTLEREVVD
jgi:hypothetical protein